MNDLHDHERANEKVVLDFIAAVPRLDPDEIIELFTDDAVYHNIPLSPAVGKANVLALLRGFLGTWTATTWDVTNLAVRGNVVFTERVDHVDAGGKKIALPVAGVFEIRDGKIAAWRDYFDLGTYQRAMS